MPAISKMPMEIHGQKVVIERWKVTPELAEEWLKRNESNRNLRPKHVSKLARAMEQGEFHFVGDPIRFGTDGRVLDGQHRLFAVMRSGTTHEMLVIFGLDGDTQQYMDAGKPRTTADQVGLQLGKSAASVWSSVVRLLVRWDAEDLLSNILVPTDPEVIAFIRENDTELERAVRRAKATYSTVRGSMAVSGAAYFQAEQIDPVRAASFWGQLATGENLSKGDPVFVLRDAMLRRRNTQRWTQVEELAAYVRCWNFARTGRTLSRLTLTRGEFTAENFRMK